MGEVLLSDVSGENHRLQSGRRHSAQGRTGAPEETVTFPWAARTTTQPASGGHAARASAGAALPKPIHPAGRPIGAHAAGPGAR
eukprot:5037609-Lingulodinium_polyedra.AAC.1